MEPQSTRYPNSAGATLGGCSRTFIFFKSLSQIDTFGPRALPPDLGPFRSRSGRPSGTFIFSFKSYVILYLFGLGLVRWLWEPSGRIGEGRQNDDLRSANPQSNPLICWLCALRSKSDTPGVIRRSVGCLGCAMDPAEYRRSLVKSVDLPCDLFVLRSLSEIPLPRCNPLIYGLLGVQRCICLGCTVGPSQSLPRPVTFDLVARATAARELQSTRCPTSAGAAIGRLFQNPYIFLLNPFTNSHF